MRSFVSVASEDRVLNQIQSNIATAFNSVLGKDILDGVLIENIDINGSKDVEHKLGRLPRGYIVVKKNSNVSIWDSESKIPTAVLKLNSSGSVRVSLWVF